MAQLHVADDSFFNALIRRTLLTVLILANALVWLSLVLMSLSQASR